MAKTLLERWSSRVVRGDGCWLWVGVKDRYGYGRFANTGAHRLAWTLLVGPIPEGMQIDHMCKVRACCNPAHLRVVDPLTNVMENSNGMGALNAKKSRCPKCGGAFRVRPNGSRECRPCQRLLDKAWRERNPDYVKAMQKQNRERRKARRLGLAV